MAAHQHTQGRPRSKSMLSFGSVRSHRSAGSVGKMDLVESPKEKSARRMTSKADPTMAMNEAQPAAQALEQSTIESIRSIQHRDGQGNIITDPDRSNPTRPRLERPLDTIRSFEAAIDGSYNKRCSTRLEPQDSAHAQNRRSSYYQGYNNSSPQQRFPGDSGGYYSNRASYARPESYIDAHNAQSGHYNQSGQPRRFGPRANSDPTLYGNTNQNVYPTQGYQQSYDTVTSASGTGSHGTDQWGMSTNPSSENSSIDKVQPISKPVPTESYGFTGFGGGPQFQGPILEEHDRESPAYGQPGYGRSKRTPGAITAYGGAPIPPAPPPHAHQKEIGPRVPMKLGPSTRRPSQVDRNPSAGHIDSGDKRQSWLKRRFSRKL